MRGEPLKGHLDLLLLAVIRQGPLHGYAIIDELRRRSAGAFDLPEGTIYPALHRLEKSKLLTSRWQRVGPRRKRRIYRLTRRGEAAYEDEKNQWRSFSGAMETVVA